MLHITFANKHTTLGLSPALLSICSCLYNPYPHLPPGGLATESTESTSSPDGSTWSSGTVFSVGDSETSESTTTTPATSSSTATSTSTGESCDEDGFCETKEGENPSTCPHDCGVCDANGTCEPAFETPLSCSEDCGATACNHDGEIDALSEQCDDGNMVDEDACTNACDHARCGDQIVHEGVEGCDAGVENGDNRACTSECKVNVCGDGLVWEEGEECDDGNNFASDGCSPECEVERRLVFLSSTKFSGALWGLKAADKICQDLAAAEGWSGTFMAWLSNAEHGPSTRFGINPDFAGPFHLADQSTVVAMGWKDLIDGNLDHPIDMDETGTRHWSNVWTHTRIDGKPTGTAYCMGWMSDSHVHFGWVGRSSKTDIGWTQAENGVPCSAYARLYCFQVSE